MSLKDVGDEKGRPKVANPKQLLGRMPKKVCVGCRKRVVPKVLCKKGRPKRVVPKKPKKGTPKKLKKPKKGALIANPMKKGPK